MTEEDRIREEARALARKLCMRAHWDESTSCANCDEIAAPIERALRRRDRLARAAGIRLALDWWADRPIYIDDLKDPAIQTIQHFANDMRKRAETLEMEMEREVEGER